MPAPHFMPALQFMPAGRSLTQDVAGSDALAAHVHGVCIHQLAAPLNVLKLKGRFGAQFEVSAGLG